MAMCLVDSLFILLGGYLGEAERQVTGYLEMDGWPLQAFLAGWEFPD